MRSPTRFRLSSLRALHHGLSWLAVEVDRQPRRLLGAVVVALVAIVGIAFAIVEPSSPRVEPPPPAFVAAIPQQLVEPPAEPPVKPAVEARTTTDTASVPIYSEEPTYTDDAAHDTIVEILSREDTRTSPNAAVAMNNSIPTPAERALPPDVAESRPASPTIAIIIDDLGYARRPISRLVDLGQPITLSFLPYGPVSAEMSQWAASRGREIFLHLPMEPLGPSDPGPNALYVGLPSDEIERRVNWAIGQIPGAKGVNNHMGSFATSDVALVETLMSILENTDLSFVDSLTSSSSVAGRIARRHGIPSAVRNVFLDHLPTEDAIRRQLAALEREARYSGTAIAIGHPYAVTLAALDEWVPAALERGVRLATVSDVIAAQRCRQRLGRNAACSSDEMMVVEELLAN